MRETLNAASERLADVSDTPRLDAELLMAYALGVERDAMLLSGLGNAVPAEFEALLARRLAQEPVAYITGSRDFWTIRLRVTPNVLIPRPDSETLIEAAVEFFNPSHRLAMGRGTARRVVEGHGSVPAPPSRLRRATSPSQVDGEDIYGPRRVLDLGTGSGALLLAALDQWPSATGIGVDVSEDALNVASDNAHRIAPGRAEMRLGDWADGIEEQFNLILCNPPYIDDGAALPPDVRDYEPAGALFAGADGLDCYRKIIPALPSLLAPGGMIAIEIGSTQAEPVSALFREAGLTPTIYHDLARLPRVIVHFTLGSENVRA